MMKVDVTPALLRKYFYEIVTIGLTAAVVYLFWHILFLEKFIRNDMLNNKAEMIRALERNTQVIQENTYYIRSDKTVKQ